MTEIHDIEELNLPEMHKETILLMVSKIQSFPVVKSIILFGSCARQSASARSDIDLALVVPEPISPEEEWSIDCSIRNWESNIACDVIFLPESAFGQGIEGNTIIRPILKEGVRLDGLLHQRV